MVESLPGYSETMRKTSRSSFSRNLSPSPEPISCSSRSKLLTCIKTEHVIKQIYRLKKDLGSVKKMFDAYHVLFASIAEGKIKAIGVPGHCRGHIGKRYRHQYFI